MSAKQMGRGLSPGGLNFGCPWRIQPSAPFCGGAFHFQCKHHYNTVYSDSLSTLGVILIYGYHGVPKGSVSGTYKSISQNVM